MMDVVAVGATGPGLLRRELKLSLDHPRVSETAARTRACAWAGEDIPGPGHLARSVPGSSRQTRVTTRSSEQIRRSDRGGLCALLCAVEQS